MCTHRCRCDSADHSWLAEVCFIDVSRVIVAWDRLTQLVPKGRLPVEYLRRHTSGLSSRLPHDLRRTRDVCAHPHTGDRSQEDLDCALVTACHALAQPRPEQ